MPDPLGRGGWRDEQHPGAAIERAEQGVGVQPASRAEPVEQRWQAQGGAVERDLRAGREYARQIGGDAAAGDMRQRLDGAGGQHRQEFAHVDPGRIEECLAQGPVRREGRWAGKVEPFPGDDRPHQREAVGMQSVARQRQHDIPRLEIMAREHAVPFNRPHRETGKVVGPARVEARQFGCFATRQRTSGLSATLNHPLQHLERVLGVEAAGREVIEKEERLRALHQEIIDGHRNEVDPDSVVPADRFREQQLGPNPVGRGHEQRVPESLALEIVDRAEAAEVAGRPGPGGRAGQRRQPGQQPLSGAGVDARP